jgi:ribosomal protein L17
MSKEKIYRVKKIRSGMNGSSETIFEGSLDHLKSRVFGYTLECGASWNPKINRNPKTINALITSINKSYDEIEGGYTRSWVELID